MINTEVNEFATQSNLTQVASYFNIVEEAIKTGDTNKRYTISTNACNAPGAPFKAGSTWTSVVISPVGDNMCDLYNSYITATFSFDVNLDKVCSSDKVNNIRTPSYWIGFKDAMDSIEQYQLIANGTSFYTQSNAIEESYITSLATTDMVKSVDIFSKTKHSDVWEDKATHRLGAIVDGTQSTAHVTFDVKIDLRRFLPLASIKMIPAFIGNMEIRIKFSKAGLVCTPLPIEYSLLYNISNLSKLTSQLPITNKFVPVGEAFTMISKLLITASGGTTTTEGVTTGATITSIAMEAASRTVTVTDMEVSECHSHLHCFGLDDNLYNGLVARYMKESLSFPIQTLHFQSMSATLDQSGADFVITSTPRFVDTIFILMQYNQNYRTCYDNPLMKSLNLKMGGYGVIPDMAITSYGPSFYEMCSNAFNVNNDLTGFNEDVMKSLTNNRKSITGMGSHDVSNFVLAFPTSTDFTFQQGQTSNSPITYQFRAQWQQADATTGADGSPFIPASGSKSTCLPVIGFLCDSVFAIQLRPVGPPMVAIDQFDITSAEA